MLERAAGLTGQVLEAIADLERCVIERDGGRLKLEWATLKRRSGDCVEDLLWWDGERLLGFLGLYRFGRLVELAGMVAPEARRQGIATALLDAALPLCADLGYGHALLIVPRASEAGRELALRRGGRLHHSEHALGLSASAEVVGREPAITLRRAIEADLPILSRLLTDGFGEPAPEDLPDRLDSARSRIALVELDGSPVGTLSVARDGSSAGIYGFVIDPALQGRGLGRAALRQACGQLREEGVSRITLEVAVENERALGLYTSVGFVPVTTEDYYELAAAP